MRILFITPHLSTGGLPQYLLKTIESLIESNTILCVEYDGVSGDFTVQRDKLKLLLGDNLVTLGVDKHPLISKLITFAPDVVHMEEIPEYFMDSSIADILYKSDRPYILVETSHDSSFDVKQKVYFPDKFLLVSQYQVNNFKQLDIPCVLMEYPIDRVIPSNRREMQRQLGFDTDKKHVINVGLFTMRKNQAEIIEYARSMLDQPIQFHFIGNQADNFRSYWEPLMKNFPSNCKWWGERSDVDRFYQAADLFLFTSRGTITDKETSPLVIREAISYNVPSLIYNLPVYLGMYDSFKNIKFLDFEDKSKNLQKILQAVGLISEEFPGLEVKIYEDASWDIKPNMQKSNSPREIFIVSCFPNVKEKERLLNDTVTKLKSLGKIVLIASHFPVPSYIVEKADYYIYDAYNMIDEKNHTLDIDGPDFWVSNETFRVDSIITNHASALSRIFGLAMEFIKTLGFEYFVILESDSEYSPIDLDRFDEFRDRLIKENKELFFFSPKFSEFAWQGGRVYETYCFGGFLESFVRRFKFPITMAGWDELIMENKYFRCFEYLLSEKFKADSDKFIVMGTLKSEFLNSRVDLFTVGECSGVFYNVGNEKHPILFLYNHDSQHRTSIYDVGINMHRMRVEVLPNNWYYLVLDLESNETLTIHINTTRDNKLWSETVTTVTSDNVGNISKFKRIKFN